MGNTPAMKVRYGTVCGSMSYRVENSGRDDHNAFDMKIYNDPLTIGKRLRRVTVTTRRRAYVSKILFLEYLICFKSVGSIDPIVM